MRSISLSSLSAAPWSPPAPLPARWAEIRATTEGTRAWRRGDGLLVMAGVELHDDDRTWLHVSFSRRDRLPSWDDIKAVKRLFVGPDKCAVQILPPEVAYVNEHPNCLHLWHCMSDPDLIPWWH